MANPKSNRFDAYAHSRKRALSQYNISLSNHDYMVLSYQIKNEKAEFIAYDPDWQPRLSWNKVMHGETEMIAIYDETARVIVDFVKPQALEQLRRAGVEVGI